MDEVFKNLPLAEQKKMLDHLAKLPDVRFLSSEEREKYDESIKAADDYYGVLMSYYMNGIDEGRHSLPPFVNGYVLVANHAGYRIDRRRIEAASGVVYISAAPFRLAPHALKGQKLLAQGNTLGINEI